MTDWDELRMGGRLADRVLVAVRRSRWRRWAVVVAAGLVVIAAALVVLGRGGPSSAGATDRDRAAIYAAALADSGSGDRVYIRGSSSATEQAAVRRLLGPDVQFGTDPVGSGRRSTDVLADLAINGDTATIRVELLCGPLCGHGKTLVLTRSDGRWHVTGTTGPVWVS
jgi:hypothetical protein